MLTDPELLEVLRDACDRAGSQQAWAFRHGISESYVCDVLRGRRVPGAKVLTALGYRRAVSYEPINVTQSCD